MTAPLYELRNGELVGDGCHRTFAYVAQRVRSHCYSHFGLVTPGARNVLDRLLSEYPNGQWWKWRNQSLLSSVCRDALAYVENLDNWTDDDLAQRSTLRRSS